MARRGGRDNEGEEQRLLDLGLTQLAGEGDASESNPPEPDIGEEYSALASSDDWKGLSELSERNITGNSSAEDAEARLWWIKAQSNLRAVPIAILAAPLDLISRDLSGGLQGTPAQRGRIVELLKSLLPVFAESLKSGGDEKTAQMFMERAEKLNGSVPAIEQARAPSGLETGGKKAAPKARAKRLNRESERLREELGLETWTEEAAAPESQHRENEPARENGEKSFWRSYFLIGLAASLLLMAGLVFYMRELRLQDLALRAEPSSQPLIATRRDAGLVPPSVDRTSNVNTLSTLLYTMDEKKNVHDQDTSASAPAAETPAASKEPPAPQLPKTKEKINTDSPRESYDEPHVDRPPPERDKLFGGDRTEARSPFGDDERDRALPVEKFREAKLFTITTDTLVMPSPSLRAKPVSRLRKGDEILVESKVGYWLRIRSHSGRIGFVLAQDAQEPKHN